MSTLAGWRLGLLMALKKFAWISANISGIPGVTPAHKQADAKALQCPQVTH